MAVDVSRIQGSVEISGLDQAVTGLNTLSTSFDKAGTSSTAALRQINQFGTLSQTTQTAAAGVNALANASQQYTQAARARVTVDDQLEKVQLRLRLAQTDASGRVAILRQQYEQLAAAARPLVLSQDEITKRTIAATQAAVQLANAERAVAREQQSQLQSAAGGFGRGVLQGVGAGGILGGLGIAGGVAIATKSLIDLGKASTDLAIRAETIGTAYEAATKRAGINADDLTKRLNAAARGTVDDASLQQSALEALALGVGKDANQIADLLAIARQKGKDFGLDTGEAFRQLVEGVGRASPEILNNLGIIVDGKRVYDEYAKSIGTSADKLTSAQKVTAITNDLISKNTDLVGKNASANLDAADKIARSQATIDQAKTRIGAALLPGLASAADTASIFIESITGGISGRGDEINRKLAAQASSFEDYVKRYTTAVNQLNPSGRSHAGTLEEDVGQYLALTRLTQAQFDEIQNMERLGNMAGRTKDDFVGLTTAIESTTAALTKEDYDRLSTSLQVATEQGLKPFKAAVDAAKTSLDAQKASTAAAKDTVDSISGALDKAKAAYKEFASARLVEDQKYQQQLFDLDRQSAEAERKLLEFKAPGAGLDQAINPIKDQIDAADASLKGYASDLDEINSFVEDQTRTVKDAEAAQKSYDDAVGSAKDNLDAQQSRLEALQGVYDNLGEAIQSAKRDMDDLRHTALVGEGALDDKLFAMEEGIKAQELRIAQAKLRGADKDDVKKLTEQLDRLRTAEDAARLAGELRYDKQHRALEQQGVPRDEKTFQDATNQIHHYQDGINQLADAQEKAGTAVDDQKARIRDAQFDLMDATAVQRDHTKAVDAEKAALDSLKESQSAISKQYDEQKTKLADLKTLLDTTTKEALKPFQDQIDEIARQASLAKIAEKLEIDPLRRKIEETTDKSKLLTFQEIIDGITNTNAVIAILEPRLTAAQNVLKKEQDATKVLQDVYDGTTKALSAQQTYFDNLKQGLDALKANLQGSKDIWGDLSTLIGAINAANGSGGMIGPKVPANIGGSGPYDIGAINSIIGKGGGGMTGQGALLVKLSQQYGIPLPLALAMLQHESQFDTTGASVANNNPGNLKLTSTTESYGGMRGSAASDGGYFAKFQTVAQGVEAYFKLLSDFYGDFIKNGDLAGLIGKYAPSSSNDTAGYITTVQNLITKYLELIVKQAAGATGMGPLAAGEAALGIPGSQVTTQFSAAHQGIDLAGSPEGTPIHALQGGRVILSQWSDLYGNMVEVANATTGKIEEYYGHLAERLVKVGDLVSEGTVIGTLGGTGSASTGVHLHLQMYDEQGNIIDPMAALARLFGTGEGPTAADLQVLLRYLNGIQDVNGAMTDLGPNLPVLAGQIAGVGDAAAAAAAGIDDAVTGIVNATDEILDHIGYKNKDGAGQLAYINQNGGLGADTGNFTRTPGDGMSVGGPHFGDPIVTGAKAGMGFGDGWQQGIEDITPQIEDTTTTALQGLYDDVLVPWQDDTRDFFSGAGFGFIGAASEGINSAGGGLAESAGNVGNMAGSSFVGGLRGGLGGLNEAVAAINAALAQITTSITATVHVEYDDPGRPGSGQDLGLNRWMRARGDR